MKRKILTTILPIVGTTAVVAPVATLTSCSKAIEVNVDQLQTGSDYAGNRLKSEPINVSKGKVYIANVDASKMTDDYLGQITFSSFDWIAGEAEQFKFAKVECSIANGKWEEQPLADGDCEIIQTSICAGHKTDSIRFRFSFQDDYQNVVVSFHTPMN